MRRRHESGFTLIEMMIVAILMAIVVAAVAMIFQGATAVIENTEAQHDVTQAGRLAFERVSNDLYGALSFNSGAQRMIMQNGICASTGVITYQAPGGESGPHLPQGSGGAYQSACDRMIFRSNTTFGAQSGLFEMTYELEMDPDPKRQKTVVTQRPIFTLMRRARVMMPAETIQTAWTGVVPSGGGAPLQHPGPTGNNYLTHPAASICCEEVAHYLLSFNLEYMASTMNFSQLQNPAPHPFADALGNGAGANDGVPGPGNPYRIAYIRVTMIVVDDLGERNERVLSRVVAIPMG